MFLGIAGKRRKHQRQIWKAASRVGFWNPGSGKRKAKRAVIVFQTLANRMGWEVPVPPRYKGLIGAYES